MNISQSSQKMRPKWAIIHVVVWLSLFSVPMVLYAQNNEIGWRFPTYTCFMLTSLLITFYSNFLWAIDKLFYKRKIILFLLFNIVLFALLRDFRDLFTHLIEEYLGVVRVPKPQPTSKVLMWIFNDLVFSTLAVGISFAVRYGKILNDMEIERNRAENEALTSRLSLLKYQIQPHFFFNTLNNIYAMIGVSPAMAQKAVHSLSKLMRYVLYDSQEHYVDVEKEAEFLKNYATLMKIRLNSESNVVMDFPEKMSGAYIPSLLLVPLLENAFKHGVDCNGRSEIESQIRINDDKLTFRISNTICSSGGEESGHSGIGIVNLHKRLDILFGKNYQFTTNIEDGDKYVATMTIPIQKTIQDIKEPINNKTS